MVEDRQVDRRRPGEHRDPFLGDPAEHRRHVEHRLGDDRRSLDQGGDEPRLVAEGVEERIDDQVAVTGGQPDDRRPVVEHPHGLTVGRHHTLRPAGRAGGEDDVGERRRGDRGGSRPGCLRVDRLALGEELGPRLAVRRGLAAQDDDPLEGRELLAVEGGDVVVAEEPADAEQDPGTGRVQHVGGLAALEPGVERDDDAAGAVQRRGRRRSTRGRSVPRSRSGPPVRGRTRGTPGSPARPRRRARRSSSESPGHRLGRRVPRRRRSPQPPPPPGESSAIRSAQTSAGTVTRNGPGRSAEASHPGRSHR